MEYITVREAVQLCRASEKKLREAIEKGVVSHVMLKDRAQRRGSWNRLVTHVLRSEVETWIMENQPAALRKEA